MGTHQLPPRHALLPSLQSPTADNHNAAAHDIQKIFEKNLWRNFHCYCSQTVKQAKYNRSTQQRKVKF